MTGMRRVRPYHLLVSLHRLVPLVAAVLFITAACDEGYGFQARNDSNSEVVVLFGGSSADPHVVGYAVPAGAYGLTLWGLGLPSWRGLVRVLDPDCTVIWEGRIAAQSGGAVVAADGTVTWSPVALPQPSDPADASPRPTIKGTTNCGGQPGDPGA